jgi:hypothetical protein
MNHDDYSKRQKTRDSEYEREYRAWINSLPADERRKLEAQGLAAPDVAYHGNGSATGDAADSPVMRIGDDPALLPDPEPDPGPPPQPEPSQTHAPDTELIRDAVRRVLGEIICHGNSRLTAECIAIVTGLNFTGASMTEVARKHGVTRAAVSKRCVELTELLGLRPSRAMRPLTSRTASRSARIQITRSYENTNPTA